MSAEDVVPASYWVVDRQLRAGEYPGSHLTDRIARARLEALARIGVTRYLDLTEEDELRPYAHLLPDPERMHHRVPIRDMDVTTGQAMGEALDVLAAWIAEGEVPYVHCWGGVGRTGTLVGCHLVESGLLGEAALAELTARREGFKPWYESPQTPEQVAMVRAWKARREGPQGSGAPGR